MKELTALLKGGAIAAPVAPAEDLRNDPEAVKPEEPQNTTLAETKKAKAKAEKPVEQPKAEEQLVSETPLQIDDPLPTETPPAEEAHALTYDEVAKSVKAAAMRSRAKAMEILASFKIKHLSEAKPAQYPAIKAALDEIVAGAP